MINFRFHLVSLVAVFLALALGVVMGSTVIDRAIVGGLRGQIESVRRRADAVGEANDLLRSQVKGLEAFAEQSLPSLVGRRLEQVPVAVVAIRGVDPRDVRSATEALRGAGAILPGVVWLEEGLAVPDPSTQAKLAQVMGDSVPQGDDLRLRAIDTLGRRLALGLRPAAGPPTPATPAGGDVLVALSSAGFVSFDVMGGENVDLSGYPPSGSRMLVIDGSQGKIPPGVVTLPLVRASAAAGARVALGEVFRPTAVVKGRGTVVRGIREDNDLASTVSTVDDLDEVRGRAALALAVEELGLGRSGHYGQGPGAARQLPDLPPALRQSSPAVARRP